jgi:hypothetical protein
LLFSGKGELMDKRIVYTNDDGGVSVIIPADECGLTIEQIAAKDVPSGKTYSIVDVSEIPSDRTHRNAWKHEDGKIIEDELAVAEIDAEVAQKEVDALVAEKVKTMAVEALKTDGILNASGTIKTRL